MHSRREMLAENSCGVLKELGWRRSTNTSSDRFANARTRPASPSSTDDEATLVRLFDAQAQSRHLDFAARWLQKQGKGYYTIGSAGHESNAAIGLMSRTSDPALLHYRSGGFYAGTSRPRRFGQPGSRHSPEHDVRDERSDVRRTSQGVRPSGPRHHPADLDDRAPTCRERSGSATAWISLGPPVTSHRGPRTPIVVCSFGDASVNHSTAAGRPQRSGPAQPPQHPLPRAVRLRGQRHRPQHEVADRLDGGRTRESSRSSLLAHRR